MSIFRTTTRSSYGLVTSAGRLVLAHVVELPAARRIAAKRTSPAAYRPTS